MDPVVSQLIGMLITGFVSIAVALISSGGFWSQMEKKNGIKDSIEKVAKQTESLSKKMDENEARRARRQILRFSDELTQQIKHSKDYFDDVLADIDVYDKYCKNNPDFPNNRTLIAEKNIKQNYEIRLQKNDFL